MPGKWSKYKATLPKAPVDSSFLEKVNASKAEFRQQIGDNINLLGEEYDSIRAKKETLEEEIKELNVKIEALVQMVVERCESEGLTMVRLNSGTSLSLKDDPYSQVVDKDAFLDWIKKTNREALLSVHYQTMNSLVKEFLEEGQDPPPGIKVYIKTGLTRRSVR